MTFRSDFTDIDERVMRLFAMVSEGLAAATTAFLDADREGARDLVAAERDIDALESVIEHLVAQHLEALSVRGSSALGAVRGYPADRSGARAQRGSRRAHRARYPAGHGQDWTA